MRYIGLDLGTRTVGVAYSDLTGTIALPDQTYRFNEKDRAKTLESALKYVKIVVEEKQGEKIVLGLPKNMDNTLGDRALLSLDFKKKLEDYFGLEVIMEDERLTSVISNNILLSADISRQKRKKKVDGIAAQIILQSYLDKENSRKNER